MTLSPTISTTGMRRERPLVDVANTRFPRSGRGSPRPPPVLQCSSPLGAQSKRTPETVKRSSPAEFELPSASLNVSVSDVEALGTGTPAALTPPAKAPTVPAPASAAPVATAVVASDPSVSATPQNSPFKAGAASASAQAGAPGAAPDTTAPAPTDTTTAPTPPRRISRATRSSARSLAVPFPTISEETFDMQCDPSPVPFYNYSANSELARGREWEKEIARRQENIKELRDRKIRLEQVHQTRPRKTSPYPSQSAASGSYNNRTPSYSYLTSNERKFTADDVEFLSILHSSVVWRLWHVDLSPEIFASERMLATRLHLVLMRYGKKDIPVPPIVALSKSHLVGHGNTTRGAAFSALGGGGVMGGFGKKPIPEKEKKGIQSLEQLVAKSLLRKGEGSARSVRGRRRIITYGYPDAGEGYALRGSAGRAKARREATSPLAVSW